MTVFKWSERWSGWLCGLDGETCWAVKCRAQEVTLKKSLTIHLELESEIFAARRIGKNGDVGYHYGSLM